MPLDSQGSFANRVLVTGAFRFPKGDAGGGRVLGLGKALRQAGYSVQYLCLPSESNPVPPRPGPHCYQGFEYWTFPDAGLPPNGSGSRLSRYMRSGEETLAAIAGQDFTTVRAVVAYGGTSLFLLRLKHLCSARGVPMVADCVEWFHYSQGRGGILGATHLDDSLRMRVVLPRLSGVIGISSFLGNHYAEKGCATVVLPPVIDTQDPEWPATLALDRCEGPVRLAFTGSPHRERWDLILSALDRLEIGGQPTRVSLFGGSEAELVGTLGAQAERWPQWRRHVEFQGRLDRALFLEKLAGCDASFLLREDARWSRACFPSKVPELLRLGLPLLYNDTSDLCKYLGDGQEGFLVGSLSQEAFAGAVERLAGQSSERRMVMRAAAVRCAEERFDYRGWVEPLDAFFRELH